MDRRSRAPFRSIPERMKKEPVMAATKEFAAAAKVTTPSDREIRIERVFSAPRARVWRAFTDPELVKQSWGRGNKLVIERMEVEPGGHWRYVEHGPDGVHGGEEIGG